MKKSELFRSKLMSNGWSEMPNPEVLHQQTHDVNLIKNATAYLIIHPQPNFQVGLALFEADNVLRMRLYNVLSGQFNWLQIEYKDNFEALLNEIISMQNELPSKGYFSLMSGAFTNDVQVSLLAWEQF